MELEKQSSATQNNLDENNNDLKVLLAMCLGLKPDDSLFANPDHEMSFYNRTGKREWTPMTKHLADKVQRRHFIANPSAKPCMIKSKTKADLKKILCDEPITSAADVEFLLKNEEIFRNKIIDAEKEKESMNNNDAQSTRGTDS